MTREWKPGEAAVTECMGMEIRGIVDTDGRFYTTDQRAKGVSSSAFAPSKLRPLAVIDAEDRRECQRLLIAICKAADISMPTILGTDAMQAALREFANPTPPKPDEPMGLGAVVEDESGTKWIRHDSVAIRTRWLNTDDCDTRYRTWDDINVVRVLSEGVQS